MISSRNYFISFYILLNLAVILSVNNAQQLDFETIKNKIKDSVDISVIQSQLPAGIQIPNELLNASLPSIEETTQILKEKCIKMSGSDAAFEEASQGAQSLNECLTNLVNVTALQEEIEKATPIGELDTVFNKYCRKKEIAITCLTNFTNTVDPCLEPQEKDNKGIVIDVFTSLVNFACEKDGDHIALFIAEKGPECLKGKQLELIDCVNTTFKGYLPAETPKTINDLPVFKFGKEECNDIMKLRDCSVKVLEKCEEPTTANLADALFKFIRSKTPCDNISSEAQPTSRNPVNEPNAAHHLEVPGVVITSIFLMAVNKFQKKF